MEGAEAAPPARRKYQVRKRAASGAGSVHAAPAGPDTQPPDGGDAAAHIGQEEPAAARASKREKAAANGGQRKRRKRMDTREALKQLDAEGVDTQRMKMTDLIWRAEALEKLKAKDEPAIKAAPARRQQQEEAAAETTTAAAPQVQIVDGRIVINEESLVVSSRGAARTEADFTRVDESVQKLNNHSYSNRTPAERWKAQDTDKFYKALEQFGTDFGIIQQLFPGRTRRQVKAKYKNEERCNPRRLAHALDPKSRGHVYHEDLVEMLRPPPVDEVQEVLDEDDAFFTKPGEDEGANAGKGEEEVEVRAGADDVLGKKDEEQQGEEGEGAYPYGVGVQGFDFVVKEGDAEAVDVPETEGPSDLTPSPEEEEYKDSQQQQPEEPAAPEPPPMMALFSYQMV